MSWAAMNSQTLYLVTPNERAGAGEFSLPVRARAKIIRDHPVCDPGLDAANPRNADSRANRMDNAK
jgi:hypothetical protein